MSRIVNLLPPDIKEEVVYARRNNKLLTMVVLGVGVLAGLGLTSLAGGMFIKRTQAETDTQIAAIRAVNAAQELDKVKGNATKLTKNVDTLVSVLTKQVVFSKLLQEIGRIMPPGTILGDISLSQKVEGAMDLTARAKSASSASLVQVNLSHPSNTLFRTADTITVSCESGTTDDYPCSTTIRALFKSDLSITTLSPKKAAAPAATGTTEAGTVEAGAVEAGSAP